MQLDDRKKRILGALVDCYISTGEPVGSKLLAGALGNRISPATIRNEMSEMAEMGLLNQPHTSAGRIPTQVGFRYYVDTLMGNYALTELEQSRINVVLRLDANTLDGALLKASELLAAITGCVAVSAAPRANIRIRHVEVLAAGKHSVLVVLVATPGVLRSRLCKADDIINDEMLTYFANLLKERLEGLSPEAVTPELMENMERALHQYTKALLPVLEAVFDEIAVLNDEEVFLGGETNLFCFPDFHNSTALEIAHFLEEREHAAKLVGEVHQPVKVRIGTENEGEPMRSSSVIAAPYRIEGKTQGTVGIIGPIRMHYAKLVSHIEYFSTVLSKLFDEHFADE
ncbi:MAG TPA: heat-inducible transcription repressor HrcA [Ruminococcaceae bacterium]|nr:heat-inducible transcription repressor HrcA [Oscillospiraceae bacterium]